MFFRLLVPPPHSYPSILQEPKPVQRYDPVAEHEPRIAPPIDRRNPKWQVALLADISQTTSTSQGNGIGTKDFQLEVPPYASKFPQTFDQHRRTVEEFIECDDEDSLECNLVPSASFVPSAPARQASGSQLPFRNSLAPTGSESVVLWPKQRDADTPMHVVTKPDAVIKQLPFAERADSDRHHIEMSCSTPTLQLVSEVGRRSRKVHARANMELKPFLPTSPMGRDWQPRAKPVQRCRRFQGSVSLPALGNAPGRPCSSTNDIIDYGFRGTGAQQSQDATPGSRRSSNFAVGTKKFGPSRRQRDGLFGPTTPSRSQRKQRLGPGPDGLWDGRSDLNVVRDLFDTYAANPLGWRQRQVQIRRDSFSKERPSLQRTSSREKSAGSRCSTAGSRAGSCADSTDGTRGRVRTPGGSGPRVGELPTAAASSLRARTPGRRGTSRGGLRHGASNEGERPSSCNSAYGFLERYVERQAEIEQMLHQKQEPPARTTSAAARGVEVGGQARRGQASRRRN